MASIYPPRFRAKDSNDDPVSGAGLWVFETGTTTPAPIFTDAALSISAPNPLTSDANGYFPQFFIAAQSVVDLQVRATTSLSSTLLWQATDIDSLGAEDAATLFRNFGNNGRFQVRGAGSKVHIEVGDPDGDDIGGVGRIGGWNGTQAEEMTLDAADTIVTGDVDVAGDASVDGNLEVGGFAPFDKVLATGVFTAGASHDIALPPGYDCYELELIDFVPSATADLNARFAFDDVPTFKAGANDYAWNYTGLSASTPGGAGAASDDKMRLGALTATATDVPNHAKMTIVSGASRESLISGDMVLWAAAFSKIRTLFDGTTVSKAYGRATFIRFFPSAGTLAFKYVLRGVRSL